MANTSTETPNYGLPQWEGTDLTDWMELNPAFETIDTQMKANADAAETAQNTANGNTASIGNLTESLNNQITKLNGIQTDLTAVEGTVALHTTHLNEHDTAIQQINTEIDALQQSTGDISGDLSSAEADIATLKNQMTLAQQNITTNADHIGDMTQLETTAKGNLVSAINEVRSQIGGGSYKLYLATFDGVVENTDIGSRLPSISHSSGPYSGTTSYEWWAYMPPLEIGLDSNYEVLSTDFYLDQNESFSNNDRTARWPYLYNKSANKLQSVNGGRQSMGEWGDSPNRRGVQYLLHVCMLIKAESAPEITIYNKQLEITEI